MSLRDSELGVWVGRHERLGEPKVVPSLSLGVLLLTPSSPAVLGGGGMGAQTFPASPRACLGL